MDESLVVTIDPVDVGKTLVAALERYPDAPLEIREGFLAALDDEEALRSCLESAWFYAEYHSTPRVWDILSMYLDDLNQS